MSSTVRRCGRGLASPSPASCAAPSRQLTRPVICALSPRPSLTPSCRIPTRFRRYRSPTARCFWCADLQRIAGGQRRQMKIGFSVTVASPSQYDTPSITNVSGPGTESTLAISITSPILSAGHAAAKLVTLITRPGRGIEMSFAPGCQRRRSGSSAAAASAARKLRRFTLSNLTGKWPGCFRLAI